MKPLFDLQDYLRKLEASENIETCEKVPCDKVGKDESYIFISYSHKDYKKVYADLAGLYASNIPFFYDYKLQAGTEWNKDVRRIMQDPRCTGVIFYISENFFLSDSIREEIRLVFGKENDDLHEKRLASFSVNLTDAFPSIIQENAFSAPGITGQPTVSATWKKRLKDSFPDDVTYIRFAEQKHLDQIVENIEINFNIVAKSKHYDLDRAMFSSGKGEFHFHNGSVYKGAFENGLFSGKGTLTYSGGTVYTGSWKNGEKNGRGKMSFPKGTTYEGSWKNDKKNGKCLYTHPDGTVYDGFWKDDKRHGKGKLKRPDGVVYEGQWENNQSSGQGVCTWPDGRQYRGQWYKGNRHGQGTMKWADGSVYEGQWEKGKRSGHGTLTFSNGTVMSGLFKNDKFIGPAE